MNYKSKLTHKQLEASGPSLYKVSRNIRVTQTLSVERQLGTGHPEAASKPWVCIASVGTSWTPIMMVTNTSEVLGGVGLATPQPPSFAPGGLVLLLWERFFLGPIRPLTLDDNSLLCMCCIFPYHDDWDEGCFFPLLSSCLLWHRRLDAMHHAYR